MSEKENLENSMDDEKKWSFCPHCGGELPKIKNLKYCMVCGLDLINLTLPEPEYIDPPLDSQYLEGYNQYNAYSQDSMPYIRYRSFKERFSEEELKDKNKKLWGIPASLGIPLLAFLAMNVLLLAIVSFMFLFIFDQNALLNMISSPYFIIIASVVELVLILVPVWYVGRYLQRPTLKNRLNLMGFTKEVHHETSVLNEILIGLLFAVFGLFLVAGTSIMMQSLIEIIFNVEIIVEGPTSEVDLLLSEMDIIALILMVIVMLLIVGTSEEILFRGFMQKGLVRNIGNKWGIIITALCFTFIHIFIIFAYIFISPFTFLILFLLLFFPYLVISLMLGLLFHWRNENLIAVMIAHGVYDSLTIIIAFLYLRYI